MEATSRLHRLSLDVNDLEAVVHAGGEHAVRIARMPFEPPDAAADVERADRTSELARVEQSELGVVAAHGELMFRVSTARDRRDPAVEAEPSARPEMSTHRL